MTTNPITKNQKSQIPQVRQKSPVPQPGKDHITAEFNDFLVAKQIFDKTTTVYEVVILTYLYKYAFSSKGIFPGYRTIARNCHCGRNTVIRTLNHLVELGLITKTFRGKEATGAYRSNLYTLTLGGIPTQGIPIPTQGIPIPTEGPKRGEGGVTESNKHKKDNNIEIKKTKFTTGHYGSVVERRMKEYLNHRGAS